MNGKLKGIIACVAVVVCLVGALVVLKVTDKKDDEGSSSATSSAAESQIEAIVLTAYSTDDIASVDVSNKHGKFTVEKSETGKQAWEIKLLDGLNQSVSDETSLISDAAALQAKKVAEKDAENLSKYGFDKPQGKFVINLEDKSKRTFIIGDNLPEEKNTCYIKQDDSNTVYTISTVSVQHFLSDKKDFLDMTLIKNPEEEEAEYGKLTVSRPDLKKPLIFTDDNADVENSMMSAQVMISPIFSYLNGTNSTATTHGLWGMTATHAEVLFPKAQDFAKYGIDKPLATVLYSGNGNEYKFRIGNPIYAKDSEGKATTTIEAHFCYLEGVSDVDCIWVVPIDSLPWTTVVPEDVITSVMTYNDITSLDSIKAATSGKTTTYTVEADDKDITAAYIDGKETDVDQFKSFYQFILTCPTAEIYSVDPKGESFLTIDIKSQIGGDKLEFFSDSTTERKAIVKLNGITSYRIPVKWTEKFIKNITLLAEGKDVEESY